MRNRIVAAVLAACLAALPLAVAGEDAPPLSSADASRIVSIGGSVTETLYALGLGERIVAVDTTSTFPAEALQQKPKVGYMRALSAEGVLSMRPTLILASSDAGPPEVIDVLKRASVDFRSVPDTPSPEGVVGKIRFIAEAVGASERGAVLAAEVERSFAELAVARRSLARPHKVMFVLSLASGRVLAAGRETEAAGILELAGARNALDGFTGYKPVTEEAIIAAEPEAILMMRQGGTAPAAGEIFAMPGFSATPAAATESLIAMDGNYLLGFGPRTPSAAADLGRRLHPQHAWPGTERTPGGNGD